MKDLYSSWSRPLHWQCRDTDSPTAELLEIHCQGIALGWPSSAYQALADWCRANERLEMHPNWLRIAYFAGRKQ